VRTGNRQSVTTVLIAGGANLSIAFAKAIVGLVSGSSAVLAEAAHSVADTITEALLFTALRRGARPADAEHQFGYGKESYVWAFLAALCTFIAGAGFSIVQGFRTVLGRDELRAFGPTYVVLGIAFVIEGVSLLRAARQVRAEAAGWRVSPLRFLRLTPDTAVKAVALEDSAALVGLLIAATGLGLAQLTDSAVWDGIASIAIGVLLLLVAGTLAQSNVSLLVGRAVPPKLAAAIRAELTSVPAIESVPTLLTMQLGPRELLVAAKVDFDSEVSGDEIMAAAEEADRRLRARFPGINYLFLDPTPR
jgi:cation diffusion facilitator family transporter